MEGETVVAEDAVNKVGAMLEQLVSRFELVLEGVSGFGGRLDALRDEMVGQFSEVGRQIRFISDRIAENREAIAATRADLSAEMVRLGETLGATRVEFREQLASVRHEFQHETDAAAARTHAKVAEDLKRVTGEIQDHIGRETANAGEALRKELASARHDLGRELPAAAAGVRHEISAAAESTVKKLDAELKQTNKTLTSLTRKFERFDDRITVQTKDQDQRLRKLERRAQQR
jgi:hypothetical protein